MADLSNYLENAIANALRGGGNGTSYTAPSVIYVKLHIGAPGEAGTSNPSDETERKAIEFGAASDGVITNETAVSWEAWDQGAETLSHISLWDHETAGNCLATGDLGTPKAITDTDTFTIAIGALSLAIA